MTEEQRPMGCAHVVGLGAQTTVGRTMMSSWAAVRAGIARLSTHLNALDTRLPMTVSMASYLTEETPLERMEALLDGALVQAAAPLASYVERREGAIPLILGLPVLREGLTASYEQEMISHLLGKLSDTLPAIVSIQVILAGRTSGLLAIDRARKLIVDGVHKICLVGGVDSFIDIETLKWLEGSARTFRLSSPQGFCPGEGAGVCALASGDVAHQLGSLARIEATSARADSPGADRSGAVAEVWAEVLQSLPEEEKVSAIYSDLNGEPARSVAFSEAVFASSGSLFQNFGHLSPALWWGDVGAATGPLLVGLAVADSLMGEAHGAHALLSSSEASEEGSAALMTIETSSTSLTVNEA